MQRRWIRNSWWKKSPDSDDDDCDDDDDDDRLFTFFGILCLLKMLEWIFRRANTCMAFAGFGPFSFQTGQRTARIYRTYIYRINAVR